MKISTKADLIKVVKSPKAADTACLPELKSILNSIANKHGRSSEVRDAVAKAAKLWAPHADTRSDKNKAPKKGGKKSKSKGASKKSSTQSRVLSDEEKTARATERATATLERKKERAAKQYGDESAVSGQNMCLCGCGLETEAIELKDGSVRHKLFLQGHDAKLKGKVKLVSSGLLPKRVLSPYAIEWVERWYIITDEERNAAGIRSLPKAWEEMTEHGKRPKSWEEFNELRS